MFKEPMDCKYQLFPIELCKIYNAKRIGVFHLINKMSFFHFLAGRCRIFGPVYNKANARLLHLKGKSIPLLTLISGMQFLHFTIGFKE